MSDYATLLRKDRRLSILRVLYGAEGYVSNDSIVTRMVNIHGVTSTRDQVRSEIVWLTEQGLLAHDVIEKTMVATLTGRGLEIVLGRASHPDITRPSPPGMS